MNISVCMATHNGGRYIRAQIDSILPQLRNGDELIISDDNSTDELPDILRSYDDPQIHLLPARHFGSPVRNFEYVLGHSRNELIFLADQDDVWHPEKISIMKDKLKSVDLVVCDCRLMDQQLKIIVPSFFALNRSKPGLLKNLLKSSYMGCCMAFRQSILDKALPFPNSILIHDQWIGLIAERYFRTAFLPHILVDHRRHRDNYSSTGGQSKHSITQKLKNRFLLTKNLLFS